MDDSDQPSPGLNTAFNNGDADLSRVVENLTVQALREYDDGPLTPPAQRSSNENDLGTEENNLVVLDPDHPLMARFQKALRDQLTKREQKLTLETRETKYQLEKSKKEREDLGVELYGLQQELAKNQMFLEKEHDNYNDTSQNRKLVEQDLDETRDAYRKFQKQLDEELQKFRDLQQERDNLKLRIFYMSNAKEDIRGDIAVIRRATEKAETDKAKFEIEKQRQDMIVSRLEEKEAKIKEDISLYEWQLHNQLKQTKAVKSQLIEARMETEAIEKEKNQLMQNWTSCLIGMKRRDEANSQMNSAIRAQKQKFDSTIAEIESYKKSINKEQERNESLTLVINQRKSEQKNLDKTLKLNKEKKDVLQQEFSAFDRALKETMNQLNSINSDKVQNTNLLNQSQREIEALSQEKVKLEDEIFKKLQDKLTADKAAQYTDKLRKEQKEKLRDMERSLVKLENEIAKARLDALQTKTINESFEREIKMLQSEIDDKNKIISKSESEIRQRVLIIEHKQGQIDLYNKKIEALIEKAGGVELGPLEVEEKNLNREIDDMVTKIMELEQKWLREQNELVKLVKDRQNKEVELKNQKNNFIVLTTKKMRIEKNIESEQTNIKQLNKSLDHLRLQLEKLNKYIFKEMETKENLEKNNDLTALDFNERIKRAEKETIQIQDKLETVKQEKEQLLKDLIDVDEQIMVWERRIELAKEMKAAVDSEAGQGEIREMKFEIHRMTVRYDDLRNQQEKLIRQMEAAVLRRDTIMTRGEYTQKNPQIVTQGKLQREIAEIAKKIKATSLETSRIESEIRLLKDKQQQLATILEDKQQVLKTLHESDEAKNSELDELGRKKQENMEELLMKQRRVKYYDQLKQGRYTLLAKKDDLNEQETNKQLDRLRSLGTIVSKLGEEYPNLQPIIRKVESSIQVRLNQEEEGMEKI
ncbi:unnamed protein product [Brachionus calyciflorus]|uniref:Coiled-coil domain-containing protein 40 n=1 Tax=Brachionus calyciflorus TaxID=104777 RepID=A0A814GQM7_9BILA|nr:unnamed protein product [Brachionus calyciflorus]